MTGTLRRRGEAYDVSWDAPAELSTAHNEAGRGAELSELVKFGDALYTFDDRTGIMFQVMNPARSDAADAPFLVPKHIFSEGSVRRSRRARARARARRGSPRSRPAIPAHAPAACPTQGAVNDKGLKIEWATVKDNSIVIGSFGKEFTNNKGEISHSNSARGGAPARRARRSPRGAPHAPPPARRPPQTSGPCSSARTARRRT